MLGSSIRLGRIAGIEIGINYSLMLIALLVTYQLASLVLPTRAPDYSDQVYLVASLVGAVLFFGSILWHELAHALMARFYGIPVRRIVLFFLGGVAEIEREPRKAHQEFWIAIVGPLSSLVLGGIFMGVSYIWNNHSVIVEVFYWLGIINVILAVFNMTPGFPLDGGRVLRALLWWISGKYLWATRWASYTGQGFAALMILSGLGSLFFQNALFGSGIWTILLGLFLMNAAKTHLQSAHVRHGLSGILVGHLVRPRTNVQPHWPLSYALDMMSVGSGASAATVVDNGELVGILTVENLRLMSHSMWGNLTVETAMTPIGRIQTVDAASDLYEILQSLDLKRQPYLLVTSDEQPLGVISHRDLVGYAERQLRTT